MLCSASFQALYVLIKSIIKKKKIKVSWLSMPATSLWPHQHQLYHKVIHNAFYLCPPILSLPRPFQYFGIYYVQLGSLAALRNVLFIRFNLILLCFILRADVLP